MEQFILVNGRTIKNGAEENRFGQTVRSMKDVGKIILQMGKAERFMLMVRLMYNS